MQWKGISSHPQNKWGKWAVVVLSSIKVLLYREKRDLNENQEGYVFAWEWPLVRKIREPDKTKTLMKTEHSQMVRLHTAMEGKHLPCCSYDAQVIQLPKYLFCNRFAVPSFCSSFRVLQQNATASCRHFADQADNIDRMSTCVHSTKKKLEGGPKSCL
jgi:hypothetical protein